MQSNKEALYKYLKSHHILALATYDGRPWTATVFYAVDEQFSLYFLSEPTTRHSIAIKKNSTVACSITNSLQITTDKKVGVQIEGVAEEVKESNKVRFALSMWNKFNPGFESIINLPNMLKKIIKSKVYQVKPIYIKFYNELLYGAEGFEEFKF